MSKTRTPSPVDAILASAKLPERTVPLCLRGDLQAQVEELEREYLQAQNASVTMADRGNHRRLRDEITALQDEMREYTVTVRLRGLPRRRFNELIAEHPPREGDKGDAEQGYDVAAVEAALIYESVVEPEMTREQWQALDDMLTPGQYAEVVNAAVALTLRKVDVPFSFVASLELPGSDET